MDTGADVILAREHAQALDKSDALRHLREEFIFPTKQNIKAKSLPRPVQIADQQGDPCIYLCGNSLGLQPRRTLIRIQEHLSKWAIHGVTGHFTKLQGENDPSPFVDIDDVVAAKMAPLVGASPHEVAVMETLTANLHLLMASFYTPTKEKYKIILETKAFPSDSYVVQSQVIHHGFQPEDALVLMAPRPGYTYLTTQQILETIDEHASSTALVLLPGIQYYTGQLLDIERITAYAHSKGIIIGWDLAHAAGNVPLRLHDWNVDFAAWCTYKYLNSGPGAIGALFVHDLHGQVASSPAKPSGLEYRPRLSGWWGGEKNVRFDMEYRFVPRRGAAGFQVGNTCALAATAVLASLEVFEQTSMSEIRKKSIALTGYLEKLLNHAEAGEKNPYWIITPTNPEERGAQLNLQLEPGLLDAVMEGLDERGVVVDERKPDVIRVAPAPLYNSFDDAWEFAQIFKQVCKVAKSKI